MLINIFKLNLFIAKNITSARIWNACFSEASILINSTTKHAIFIVINTQFVY